MNTRLRDSKKAIMLIVALLNLNAIFFLSVFIPTIPIALSTQMITAILFLVGIYCGVQGGIDMISENKNINITERREDSRIDTRVIGNQKENDYRT